MTVEYHWDLIQGTDDWLRVRHGMLTASEMKNFITAAKLEVANNKETRAHVYQLAYERVTGYLDPYFESWDMQRGKIEEVYAKDLYSKHYEQIKDCGFVTNDKLGFLVGFSPDGMVGDKGQVECKSRKGNLQFQTIVDNVAPADFNVQVQTGLWVPSASGVISSHMGTACRCSKSACIPKKRRRTQSNRPHVSQRRRSLKPSRNTRRWLKSVAL